MATVEQTINVKADIEGLDKIRQGTAELNNLKKATADVSEKGSDIPMSNVSAMRNQLNITKQMHQVTKSMLTDMKNGQFVGTKEYVKGLDASLKTLKKMSDVVEDIADDSSEVNANLGGGGTPSGRGRKGAMMGLAGRFQAVGGALAGGDILTGAMTGVSQGGGALKDVGEQRGGKFGGALAKGGLAGMIAGGVLAGAYGIDKLIYGAFEKLAPQGFQFERLLGKDISTGGKSSQYRKLMLDAERNTLDRADVLQAVGAVRARSGGGAMGSAQDIMSLMKVGLSPEMAGGIMGMERRFGGGMDANKFVQLASKGGYAQRIGEFGKNVSQLTESLQNIGVDIGAKAGAEIVSKLGARYGETFRGGAGGQALMGLHQGIQGAMGLQSPEQAMMFRALYRGNFRKTMLAMEKGVAGEGNLNRMLEFVKKTMPGDMEAQARVMQKWGVKGYSQALRLVGADIPTAGATPEVERERRTRKSIESTEFGKAVKAGLPLELISESGYATKMRNWVRKFVLGDQIQDLTEVEKEKRLDEHLMSDPLRKARLEGKKGVEREGIKNQMLMEMAASQGLTPDEMAKQLTQSEAPVFEEPTKAKGKMAIPGQRQIKNEIIIQNNTSASVDHKSGTGDVTVNKP